MSNKKELNYSKALAELEEILTKLEEGELEIDDLTSKVKRASELIQFCRDKLHNTQSDVEKILEDLEE